MSQSFPSQKEATAGSEQDGTLVSDHSVLDPEGVVNGFLGPAMLLTAKGQVLCVNESGACLTVNGPEGRAFGNDVVIGVVQNAVLFDQILAERLEIAPADDPGAGERSIDLAIMPLRSKADLADPDKVLVLGFEGTLQRNLAQALISSRELFRDLVMCSSDFAWETNSEGKFIYVSAKGAAGFSSNELNGRTAASLVDPSRWLDDRSLPPFVTEEPVEEVEVWLNGASGAPCCMLISAVPVYSKEKVWTGARGVGRDVTELRAKEAEIREARLREKFVSAITDAVRTELDAQDMFDAAAREVWRALGADGAWMLANNGAECDGYTVSAKSGQCDGLADEVVVSLAEGVALATQPDAAETCTDKFAEEHSLLVITTRFRGKTNGAIVVGRHASGAVWSDEDRDLLSSVATHLGIAFAQASYMEELKRLSRTDPLTGLFNRRAFLEEAEVALARCNRTPCSAACLYIDMDGFKRINDELGHGIGDDVLREVSHLLNAETRRGDVAVRFGGDEFGLLLDNCDEEGASRKAGELLSACRLIAKKANVPWKIGFSIGISLYHPDTNVSLDRLMSRADEALYEAKESGKNVYRIWQEKA